MAYEFRYTERNIERSSDFETKTLLYLIGIDPVGPQVSFVFVDCFNDISGTTKSCSILWDYQSKGVSNMTPRAIGKALITLFNNHNSELKFSKFVLFMPKPKTEYLNDDQLMEFRIGNFGRYTFKIKAGLESEFCKRNKIPSISAEESKNVDEFLNSVIFVLDRGDKSDYVKSLVAFKDKDLKAKEFYIEIFNEIRMVQFSKKATNINGSQIDCIADALKYEKHLEAKDLNILVINRLVGVDLFRPPAIPIGFRTEIEGLSNNDAKDLILECQSKISHAIFDKSRKREFWKYLERAIVNVTANTELTPQEICRVITDSEKIECKHLSGLAGAYLISLIKEGLTV